MNKALPTGQTLERVRQEIDAIDDRILALLGERFQLVEQVKAAKQSPEAGSPLRPAREAQVLRRLIARGKSLDLDPELLVRLWPAIFCAASLRQGAVEIQVGGAAAMSILNRLLIRDYYPLAKVSEHASEGEAIAAANLHAARIAIVSVPGDAAGNWLPALSGSKTRITGALPFAARDACPKLLVIGHAAPQATSDDETLVVTHGGLPRDFPVQPKWTCRAGERQLAALPGFLSEKENPLHGVIRLNGRLGLKILGQYPAPVRIEP